MNQEWIEKIDRLQKEQDYQSVVNEILSLPEQEQNYPLILSMAIAYNRLQEEKEAIKQLERIEERGKEDENWLYEMAYALFYADREEEALTYLNRWLEVQKDSEDSEEVAVRSFMEDCKRYCFFKEHPELQVYTKKETLAIRNHIETYYGAIDKIMYGVVSEGIYMNLALILPTEEKKYYQIVTIGMGAYQMELPEEKVERDGEDNRIELMLTLPEDWNFSSKEEKDIWSLRWMEILAMIPIKQNTWLGWGSSITNSEEERLSSEENIKFSGIVLSVPNGIQEGGEVCTFSDGTSVHFYQMLPVYKEEMEFKLKNGFIELLKRFVEYDLEHVIKAQRINTCYNEQKTSKKTPFLSEDKIKNILTDWEEPTECVATDRIIVDGCKVGYMYREEPIEEVDSGWRFFAGDEPQVYVDNPDNSNFYSLNTICNYDPEILPLLHAPYGKTYIRDNNGQFIEKEEEE